MASCKQAEEAIKEGWTVRRPSWMCKVIRGWEESDHEFFANDFRHENAIIQECKKPCDCNVGVWIKEDGDEEADDYMFVSNNRQRSQ